MDLEMISAGIAQKTTTRVAESLSPLSTTRNGFARVLAVANPSCLSQQPAFPTAFHSCEIPEMHGPCQTGFAPGSQSGSGPNRLEFQDDIIFENPPSSSTLGSAGCFLLRATARFARALCNRSGAGSPLSPDHVPEVGGLFGQRTPPMEIQPPAGGALATITVAGRKTRSCS